jgi:hypothetical protein
VRHLERQHKDKKEVKKFVGLPKNSAQRKMLTTKLRLQGNNAHNMRVVAERKGDLVVVKSSINADGKSVEDYVPCVTCKGWYVKDELRRHKCPIVLNTPSGPSRKRGTVKEGRQLVDNARSGCSAQAAAVLAKMKDDKILRAVKDDPVAVALLELELQKGDGDRRSWIKNMRYRLRLLGRFICAARKSIAGAHDLKQILKCQNFEHIAEAAKRCAQGPLPTDPTPTKAGEEPVSVPVKIGFMVKAACEIIRGEALRNNDREVIENTKNLLELYDMEWGTR